MLIIVVAIVDIVIAVILINVVVSIMKENE